MAWTKTYEDAEPQRVNKWLGQSGVCSRRESEGFMRPGGPVHEPGLGKEQNGVAKNVGRQYKRASGEASDRGAARVRALQI